MTYTKAIKFIICSFWCFVIFSSIVSEFFVTKTIQNINSILKMQKPNQLNFTFRTSFSDPLDPKNIIVRNVFNVSGLIPNEDLDLPTNENDAEFFAKQLCLSVPEELPFEVLGIVYTSNSKTNLVTVQDPNVEGADIYREGDKILDYGEYSVYRIPDSTSVEFRYGAKKICRSLVFALPNVVKKAGDTLNEFDISGEDKENITILTRTEVTEEIGKGLSNIANSALITPSLVEGQIEGFKVYSITPGSLFEKIGLHNGDIVIEINNQKLDDPTKGILLYEIFQYENQIKFTIKKGTELVTRKVIIQ